MDERRKYERLNFADRHLCTTLRIVHINRIPVRGKEGQACIFDISSGGARFRTNLDLPVDPHCEVEVELETRMVHPLKLRANLMWKHGQMFGCQFNFDHEEDRVYLNICINDTAVYLKTNDIAHIFVECDFCQTNCEVMNGIEVS
ncbi:PilZ domain-containing protein [Heliophilum fasciatum]|uniref:PilZ domain-containing protein n=1 Tax=Heliophilum fasciatum TaxID=35700 RepID=A0A4R2RGA5_9FIRM|nr:PilZ domain-containing protein [Heliophilum fasciatum]MCW2278596.1 hypothetical protein [Heliophilum fasciatum]TCP62702.1 PilZ domain-containing protein [Heliophilum fasciatum]